MQRLNDLWQGSSNYWQDRFIQDNFLRLGYTAWAGYLNSGRGVVICEVATAIASAMDYQIDALNFHQEYLPQMQVEPKSQVFNLASDQVSILLAAIASYDPTEAMIIAIIDRDGTEIHLVQQTKVFPRDCYHQVQRRWAEFQLELNTSGRC